MLDSFNNIQMKSEMAHWVKYFALMKEVDFNNLNTEDFTVIQRMALNYVEQSKTDAKIAEKVIKLVHWYDTSFGCCLD